jgi:hypothetical protein
MREIIENQRWNNALLNHPKRIYNLHMDNQQGFKQ